MVSSHSLVGHHVSTEVAAQWVVLQLLGVDRQDCQQTERTVANTQALNLFLLVPGCWANKSSVVYSDCKGYLQVNMLYRYPWTMHLTFEDSNCDGYSWGWSKTNKQWLQNIDILWSKRFVSFIPVSLWLLDAKKTRNSINHGRVFRNCRFHHQCLWKVQLLANSLSVDGYVTTTTFATGNLELLGLVMFVEWPLFQVDQRNPSHIPWIISRVSLLPIGPVMEIAVSQGEKTSMKIHDINDQLGYFFKVDKGEDPFVDCWSRAFRFSLWSQHLNLTFFQHRT